MKTSVGHQLEREKRKIIAGLATLMGGKDPKKPGAPEFNAPRRVIGEVLGWAS